MNKLVGCPAKASTWGRALSVSEANSPRQECTALSQLGVLNVERACVRFCSSQEPYLSRLSTYISGMFEAAKK
jgi:hypothetical protein